LYLATEEEMQEIQNNEPNDLKLRYSTIFG